MKNAVRVGIKPNTTNGQEFIAKISKQALGRLEKLQYSGGFLRYSIDLYEDGVMVHSYDTKWLKVWMKSQHLPI